MRFSCRRVHANCGLHVVGKRVSNYNNYHFHFSLTKLPSCSYSSFDRVPTGKLLVIVTAQINKNA